MEMNDREHLDIEEYLQIVENYREEGTLSGLSPETIEHLKTCPECNETAAAFLLIEHQLQQAETQKTIKKVRGKI